MNINPVKLVRQVVRTLDHRTLSSDAQAVLGQEELHGARVANRFRYVFGLMVAVPVLWMGFSRGRPEEVAINSISMVAYLAVTLVHTIILRASRGSRLIEMFNYALIVLDFAIITAATLTWTWIYSPDNLAFAIKNPGIFFFAIPIVFTVIQFQIRLVTLSLFLFATVYFGLLGLGLARGMPTTVNWAEHVMGPAVVLPDVLLTRPMLFLFLGFTVGYAIYRSVYMIRRIGHVEAQKASLARYFSPDVVEEITSDPTALRRGQRQKITVLFSDIRNFTTMSESMDPADLADFLTEFRGRMTAAIFANGGTLDKFIGDAVMATFGTARPSPQASMDSSNAVRAGYAMLAALEEWNRERAAGSGQPPVKIGIGIHTGVAFAGTVGSESMLEFTVIGDAVNTASRIESLCKDLDAAYLVSSEVFAEVGSVLTATAMPPVQVKGKERPLQLYKLA